MKKYLINSLIQATVIGLVIFALEILFAGPAHAKTLSIVGTGYVASAIWCIVAMFIAIVGMDYINKNKAFRHKQ
jgi:uncharacterized MnhB-related membrane protein